MFGIEDPQITFAYALSIGLAALCVLYGIRNWNNGGEE